MAADPPSSETPRPSMAELMAQKRETLRAQQDAARAHALATPPSDKDTRGLREELVSQAVHFLRDRSVAAADPARKREFLLRQKGLTEAEVDEAFLRAAFSPPAAQPVSATPPPVPDRALQQPPGRSFGGLWLAAGTGAVALLAGVYCADWLRANVLGRLERAWTGLVAPAPALAAAAADTPAAAAATAVTPFSLSGEGGEIDDSMFAPRTPADSARAGDTPIRFRLRGTSLDASNTSALSTECALLNESVSELRAQIGALSASLKSHAAEVQQSVAAARASLGETGAATAGATALQLLRDDVASLRSLLVNNKQAASRSASLASLPNTPVATLSSAPRIPPWQQVATPPPTADGVLGASDAAMAGAEEATAIATQTATAAPAAPAAPATPAASAASAASAATATPSPTAVAAAATTAAATARPAQ